jgi:protease IV
MGNGSQRSGRGCAFVVGMGCAVCIAVLAGGIGLFLGSRGFDFGNGPGVAVLDISGLILDSEGVLDALETLTGNPDTKALVVRVDSPGGAFTPAEEIFTALKRTAESGIPVVASVGSDAASGGYYLCLAAERIFANKTSLTGSIGTFMESWSAHDLLQKLGVTFNLVSTGEFKGMGLPTEPPLNDRQKEMLQGFVNDCTGVFVETISAQRRLDMEKARGLADGRVFTGR